MHTLPLVAQSTTQNKRRNSLRMLQRMLGTRAEFNLHGQSSENRDELQAYIGRCFSRAYQAQITEFAPLLIELRCGESISGVAGIRPAGDYPLFMEHYLDQPVEEVVSDFTGQAIERSQIVELGNLAALRPGACQLINIVLAAMLQRAGFRYAVLVSTTKLAGILHKQQFSVRRIGAADPARLGEAAENWGSYYASDPSIILIDLQATLATLKEQPLPSAVFDHFADDIERLVNQLPNRCDDLQASRYPHALAQ